MAHNSKNKGDEDLGIVSKIRGSFYILEKSWLEKIFLIFLLKKFKKLIKMNYSHLQLIISINSFKRDIGDQKCLNFMYFENG